jgi:hypothetical protein
VEVIARLPARDRADLFTAAAGQRGMSVEIIEKDFWVCWALRQLFSIKDAPAGLLFKGGTSLAKVYKAIERFSEDVDLSFDRAGLGFGGDRDPAQAASGKKSKQRLKDLSEECTRTIRERFLPQLKNAFAESLQLPHGEAWGFDPWPDALRPGPPMANAPWFRLRRPEEWWLGLDPDDPDQQTLLFHYPGAGQRKSDGPAYIRPVVRLEIGARSDHWPAEEATLIPYAAEVFPDQFHEPAAAVKVLAAERTFWEKATVLHSWHHAPAEKGFSGRQSRHYYDVVQLYKGGVGKKALRQTDLLLAVTEHKRVFFAAAWARYDEAKPGSLRLVPPESRLAELEEDYGKMREMIFGEAPAFDHILEVLREIETIVNSST